MNIKESQINRYQQGKIVDPIILEILSDVWGVGVLNLLPSPWRSIALSPSVRRRGHILFAKASPVFLVEVSIFFNGRSNTSSSEFERIKLKREAPVFTPQYSR